MKQQAEIGSGCDQVSESKAAVTTIALQHRRLNVRYWHFADIDAARFNVRFRTLFGHQSMARLCRRMTQSGHLARIFATLAQDSPQPKIIHDLEGPAVALQLC
jgi:hypothetical protein